ncbi:MAG: cupin domain-containing protein [Roseobacter sp.]
MPKIETPNWTEHVGKPYPISGQNDGPYAEKLLGNVVANSQFSVHLERLQSGSRSSHRHWHEAEDEFIYLISGKLVLIEDEETALRAGWKAGQPIAHCSLL